jgi:hypothetical protein
MQKISVIAVCLLILLVPVKSIKAQNTVFPFDTIHLTQPEFYSLDFSLEDTMINAISIQRQNAVQMNVAHFKTGGNILGGVMTLATGFGFGGTSDVNWYLASAIRTNNPKLDWILNVYCPGYVEQERTRVTNSDGSHSVETNIINRFSWSKGAMGFIIEGKDTIGWNYVYRSPRTDTAVQKWSQQVYKGIPETEMAISAEFALVGEFTGKANAIIFNVTDNRLYIFKGNKLSGMYQCQKPPKVTLSKKKRKSAAQPYLLADAELTAWEHMDILRLAMVGLRLKSAIESL